MSDPLFWLPERKTQVLSVLVGPHREIGRTVVFEPTDHYLRPFEWVYINGMFVPMPSPQTVPVGGKFGVEFTRV